MVLHVIGRRIYCYNQTLLRGSTPTNLSFEFNPIDSFFNSKNPLFQLDKSGYLDTN